MDWEDLKIKIKSLSAEERQKVFEGFSHMYDKDFNTLWNDYVADCMKPLAKLLEEQAPKMEGDDDEKEFN